MTCEGGLTEQDQQERARLEVIAQYGPAVALGRPDFDHIVALAASLFDVPINLVSIVGHEQQVSAALVGPDARPAPRDISFCQHALVRDTVLVIEDTLLDPRFAENPLVAGHPFIRFYAGAPLRVSSGHVLGTICIMSAEPRAFDARSALQLQSLAQLVVDQLELRRSEHRHRTNELRLAKLAHFDQLTGLPNRTGFHEEAERLIATCEAATILLFDLDGFKDVNDVLGHAVGDRLLGAVGNRLRAETQESHLLARLGGDEFALLVPGMSDPRDARRLAATMRDSFRRGFEVEGEELRLDTSVGVAMAPDHGTTVEELLMAADLALYRAKDQGGGAVGFFEAHLRHRVEGRRRMQGELRRAYENWEFELLYQPQIEFAERRVVGVEALLRWNHPDHGQIAPGQFIDVLDRMPLAAAVGNWVLRTAIAQAAQWNDAGMPLRMGVNLFAAQLRSDSLPDRVSASLTARNLPAHLLELELTETVAIKNSGAVLTALTALRKIGVGLALDDFGTGYASLSLLKELPVTKLKIDKSFVQDVQHGNSDAVVVDAILRMGESFRLKVIAEGVETVEQESLLYRAGCREAQGYLYGRPMTAAQIVQLIRPRPLGIAV